MYCTKVDTSHGNANNSRSRKDGEIGEVFENRPRVRFLNKFQETPCQLETFSDTDWAGCKEHAAVQQEDTQLQDLISSTCGAKRKLLWLSVQRKPNCTA